MSNNVLRFPNQQNASQSSGQNQANPMNAIMNQFMSGMSPMAILNRMAGPQVKQAKQIIGGKNEDQLREIAINMAKQRGVDLNNLAQQMGINLPK